MAAVERSALEKAITNRKSYLLENLSTLTMKQFRKVLEKDLDLPEKALNAQKDSVSEIVDALVKAQNEAKEDKTTQKKASSEPKQPAKKEKAKTKSKPAERSKPPPATGDSRHSKRFQKMKVVCKQVGIKVPPNIYTKNKTAAEQEAALAALLEKHGLQWDSSPHEISAAQRRLAKEKDLEGIDMSNIVEGGRRSRARVDYSAVLKPSSYAELSEESGEEEDEEVDEDSSSDSDGSANSDEENVSPRNGSKRSKKTVRREEDEEEEEDDDGEEEASESPSDDAEKAEDDSSEASSPTKAGKKRKAEEAEPPKSGSKSARKEGPTPQRKGSKSPGKPAEASGANFPKVHPSEAKKQEDVSNDEDDEEESDKARGVKRRTVVDWSDEE